MVKNAKDVYINAVNVLKILKVVVLVVRIGKMFRNACVIEDTMELMIVLVKDVCLLVQIVVV